MEAGSVETVVMKRMNYKDTELFGMLSSWTMLVLALGLVMLLAAR